MGCVQLRAAVSSSHREDGESGNLGPANSVGIGGICPEWSVRFAVTLPSFSYARTYPYIEGPHLTGGDLCSATILDLRQAAFWQPDPSGSDFHPRLDGIGFSAGCRLTSREPNGDRCISLGSGLLPGSCHHQKGESEASVGARAVWQWFQWLMEKVPWVITREVRSGNHAWRSPCASRSRHSGPRSSRREDQNGKGSDTLARLQKGWLMGEAFSSG